MQTSISMPTVLRAVAAARMLLNQENAFCSSLMEESVSNQQVLSAISAATGLAMLPFIFGSMPVLGFIGLALLFYGSSKLAE